VQRVVAVTPPEACDEVRRRVGSIEVVPQPGGDLGERMRAIMAARLGSGAPAVALIGSDLPHLTPAIVTEAFALARDPDALVLGPAGDGGYYLIAARRLPDVFSNIEWGSARVCHQTEQAAVDDGFRVHRLQTMSDVDTVDDLRRAAASGLARRTAAWLAGRR
jgi:glycosyltransferase A (GT-A) superfamily protein (DUF2064 family)